MISPINIFISLQIIMAKKNWLQAADKSMQKRGTVGAFTRQAKRKKMSVQGYAKKVIKDLKGKTKTPAQRTLLRRAVFARNMGKNRK